MNHSFIWHYIIIFLLATVVASCSDSKLQEKLYDEFALINLNACSSLESKISGHESYHELNVGDSITLTRPQLFLTKYNDSLIYTGEGIYLSIGDRVVITEYSEFNIKVVTDQDSIGYIAPFWLKDDVSDGSYLFGSKLDLDEVLTNRQEAIAQLKESYGLSDDEFDELLAREHYRRTGQEVFSY